MSSLAYLLNPFNLPNLLTPSRLYVEIQFGFVIIGFVGLLFYSLRELYDLNTVSLIGITVGVTIFLLFLLYVLLSRDRLYEEVVDRQIQRLGDTFYGADSEVKDIDAKIQQQENWLKTDYSKFNRTKLNNLRDQKREAIFQKLQAKRDIKKYDKEYVRGFRFRT